MQIDQAFPSRYLRASDIPPGQYVHVVISRFLIEKMRTKKGEEHKPVLYFQGKNKGMVLVKTNADALKHAFGGETDEWIGKRVVIVNEKVRFGREWVDALRLRVPAQRRPDEEQPMPPIEEDQR